MKGINLYHLSVLRRFKGPRSAGCATDEQIPLRSTVPGVFNGTGIPLPKVMQILCLCMDLIT